MSALDFSVMRFIAALLNSSLVCFDTPFTESMEHNSHLKVCKILTIESSKVEK